jgi:hypothetical protein
MLFRIDEYREPFKVTDAVPDTDVLKMLGELRDRRDRLDEAIIALTRLVPGAVEKPRIRSKKNRA